MKRLLLAAACLGGLTSVAFAADVFAPAVTYPYALLLSGDVSVGGQYSSWSGSDSYDSPTSGFGIYSYGRALIPLQGGVAVQFDGSYVQNPAVPQLDTEALFGAHLSKRDQRRLIGVMGAVGTGGSDGETFPSAFLGAEAQAYLNNTTLFVQGGYDWAHEGGNPGDEPTRMGVVRGGVRFFVNPNLKIDGEMSYAGGSFYGYSGHIVGWGIGVEKMVFEDVLPVSFFARYQGASYHLSACGPQSMIEHKVLAGFSFKFGTTDLLAQDRLGANTDFPRFPTYPALDELEYNC